jgi:glycosyltransferase involved in cell wall biosynthesis
VRFNPGDWLVNIGCAWHYPYDADMLAALRARGVKFGVLIYDLIPELFPEWTYRGTMLEFRGFLRRTLPAAEMIFTISQNTAADVRHFMLETKMPAVPIRVLPVGSRVATRSLCPPNPGGRAYVLFVSTIEVRKNHALMFRVWQRLLRQMPAGSVPDLVFAGKIGWLTNDFLHQLENADWLGGRIKFVETPTDEALETLYRNCLFTVFPSFYEGWGLPVTESLSFGKTVAASNRGSIPEAGGDFCVYYDPDHIEDAAGVIRGLIDHPARVAALEARIARQFRPPGWAETATMLLQALAQDHARDHAPDQAPDRAPAPAIMEQAA